MKIEYDKIGFKIILIFFLISFCINSMLSNSKLVFSFASTVGVFSPILLVQVLVFLYVYLKFRKLFIYTDYRVVYLMAILEALVIYDRLNQY